MNYPNEDPLDIWLITAPRKPGRSQIDRLRREETLDSLCRLEKALDRSVADRGRKGREPVVLYPVSQLAVLPPNELPRVERIYRKLLPVKSAYKAAIQEELLQLVARAGHPSSIAFWLEMLALRRPRDSFSGRRRVLALGALALLAIRGEETAIGALVNALDDSNPDTRAQAAFYLGRVFAERQEAPPAEVQEVLARIAGRDRSFAPTFMARDALRALGLPVPRDNPEGSYSFKVWHSRDPGVFRVVEVASAQSLDTLHLAIQKAFGWGADHLYEFYLNGKLHDPYYAFSHPEVEGARRSASSGIIGELGLRPRQKFTYLFDFGDYHEFKVEVVGTKEKTGGGKLPRVVESVGKAMEQYGGG